LLQLEDQVTTKRCGHLDGKTLIRRRDGRPESAMRSERT
jgi:2-methylisocitrate lyase-like PEP mutase family enzyme